MKITVVLGDNLVRYLRTNGYTVFNVPVLTTQGVRNADLFRAWHQSLIKQYKGPTGPLYVSDYGDASVQATSGVAFDIYRFPTVTGGRKFGR